MENRNPNTFFENKIDGRIFLYDNELESIYKLLIKDNKPLVAIYGQRGVGKTALAKRFQFKYQELFPGGILHLYPNVDSLFESAVKSVIDINKPSLLIIDDADYERDIKKLDKEISRIIKSLPRTKIIMVSSKHRKLNMPITYVELTVNFRDYYRLFETFSLGDILNDKLIDYLYKKSNGNLASAEAIARLIKSNNLNEPQLFELFEPKEGSGIIGLDGRPLSVESESHKQITLEVSEVSNELLDILYKDPNEFYQLSPRKFEEVVAEMLFRMGYEVTLTSASRDGGKDIYAAKKDILSSFLYVVECKKYAPENHVGIGVIQRLYGVVQAEKATAGIVATTSYFTRDSKRFQENCSHQLSLQDYFGLISWLNQIKAS